MLAATGSPSGSGWSGGPEADNVVAGGTGHGLEQHPVVEDVEQLAQETFLVARAELSPLSVPMPVASAWQGCGGGGWRPTIRR